MATYKVWLNVRDNYGYEKEYDGGVINVDLDSLSQEVTTKVKNELDLEGFATDAELAETIEKIKHNDSAEIDSISELYDAIEKIKANDTPEIDSIKELDDSTIKYSGFEFEE